MSARNKYQIDSMDSCKLFVNNFCSGYLFFVGEIGKGFVLGKNYEHLLADVNLASVSQGLTGHSDEHSVL